MFESNFKFLERVSNNFPHILQLHETITGAFLITYGIAMVFCGIPIFFQEVAIGQYLGAGGMTLVGQLCPLLQGIFKLK